MEPLIMATLPVMNETLISRVMRNVVAQRGKPSVSPRRRAPFGFATSNQSEQEWWTPRRLCRQDLDRASIAFLHLSPYHRIERLLGFGHAIDPKGQGPALHHIR